ncbi:MAG: hypothetical protein QG597_2031, partial [Actinomycetota bacterium]|nr:hypothetical protein [Actinomycetota bacterium]
MPKPGPEPKPVPFFCPNPEHRDAEVRSRGTRVRADGTLMRRLRCIPAAGDAHWFEVDASKDATSYSAPEKCPDHVDSHIQRFGMYSKSGHPRQRYRCFPTNGERAHVFTPRITRQAVNAGEHCEACAEEKSIHAGEVSAGRGHHYTAHQVADGLVALSRGDTYASVGEAARRVRAREGQERRKKLNEQRKKKGLPALPAVPDRNKHKSTWRLAASWVETFTPVLWEKWDKKVRSEALELGEEKGLLRIVAIDDKSFYGLKPGTRSEKMRFAVMVLAEVSTTPAGIERHSITRLVRAYPDKTSAAYLLLFDELGYIPDIVVSDAANAIKGALNVLRTRSGQPVTWVISQFHVIQQLNRYFDKVVRSKTKPFKVPEHVANGLNGYACFASPEAWEKWWVSLEDALRNQDIPQARWPNTWKNDFYQQVYDNLVLHDAEPSTPMTAGFVETVINSSVAPIIAGRENWLGNLARTNQLLNLVTLRLNGQLTSAHQVAEAIRTDVKKHGGYAPPTRSLDDPGAYRSLLDPDLTETLAQQ